MEAALADDMTMIAKMKISLVAGITCESRRG